MGVLDLFIDWSRVLERMTILANDETVLQSIVEDELQKLIEEQYPRDYKDFMKTHANELDQIKRRLSRRYTRELKKRVKLLKEHRPRRPH